MSKRATEKIIEALSQLLEGFAELQDSVEADLEDDVEEDEDDEDEEEPAAKILDPDAAIVKQMKIAIESVIETDDYTPEEFANIIASLTEALEEIDPNIFEEGGVAAEEEDDDDDDDEDDIDFDDDDYDDEDDEDEDDDEEEELEEDDEEE